MKGNLIYRLPWLVCGQNMKLTLCQVSGPTASLMICWRFGSVLHVVPRQGRLVWHGISPMHISQQLSAIATFFIAVHDLLLEAKASSPCTCKWQGTQIGTYFSVFQWDLGWKQERSVSGFAINKVQKIYFGKGDLVKLAFFAVSTHRCRSLVVLQI